MSVRARLIRELRAAFKKDGLSCARRAIAIGGGNYCCSTMEDYSETEMPPREGYSDGKFKDTTIRYFV
jgi:hypothetical protein